MTLEDFKDVYKSKTPLEKLKLLLVQTDFIRDDERNLERAKANLNDGEAGYWRREISAMEDRIKWLFEQLAPMLKAQEPRVMALEEALTAIADNNPIVIESRKYGIVANWYTAQDKTEFAEWLRERVVAGTYPEDEYGITWRCWSVPPTEVERRGEPWDHAKRSV